MARYWWHVLRNSIALSFLSFFQVNGSYIILGGRGFADFGVCRMHTPLPVSPHFCCTPTRMPLSGVLGDRQSPVCMCVCVCVSAHVELAAGLSGTVGESPVVAADPPANAPGQAAALPELSVILSTASLSQPRIIFQQGRPHQL